MASLAERYEAGDRAGVWKELRTAGPIDAAAERAAACEDVARLTMERAAANIATIVVRLTAMGYRFGDRFTQNRRRRSIEDLGLRDSMEAAGRDVDWIDVGDVEERVMGWEPPGQDALAELEAGQRQVGPLPMALGALYRQVGAIDLAGSFPGWEPSAFNFEDDLDWPVFGQVSGALCCSGVGAVADYVDDGTDHVATRHVGADGRLELPFGPDHLLSANVAGAYVTVRVPDETVDPVLHGVWKRPDITLVEYLRVSFEWGGFPGFEFAERVPAEIDVLRRDLLEI